MSLRDWIIPIACCSLCCAAGAGTVHELDLAYLPQQYPHNVHLTEQPPALVVTLPRCSEAPEASVCVGEWNEMPWPHASAPWHFRGDSAEPSTLDSYAAPQQ